LAWTVEKQEHYQYLFKWMTAKTSHRSAARNLTIFPDVDTYPARYCQCKENTCQDGLPLSCWCIHLRICQSKAGSIHCQINKKKHSVIATCIIH